MSKPVGFGSSKKCTPLWRKAHLEVKSARCCGTKHIWKSKVSDGGIAVKLVQFVGLVKLAQLVKFFEFVSQSVGQSVS